MSHPIILAVLLSAAGLWVSCSRLGLTTEEANVREPAVAGQFYPGNKVTLSQDIDEMLAQVDSTGPDEPVRGIIAPHAGYEFSGKAAASAFKWLAGSKVRRVILLGPSHRESFSGVAVPSFSAYRTPLGDVPLDRDLLAALAGKPGFKENDQAHRSEHSLEVELPFLQKVLGDFLLAPLVVGWASEADCAQIAETIREYADDETVIVASSDFTHYGASFGYMPFRDNIRQNLKKLNDQALERILALDFDGFNEHVNKTGNTICGARPISILLAVLGKTGATGHLVDYYTSGDVTGDWSHCVCYASIVFTSPTLSGGGSDEEAAAVVDMEDEETQAEADLAMAGAVADSYDDSGAGLSDSDKRTLLAIARDALVAFVDNGEKTDPRSGGYTITGRLEEKRGAFVTLKVSGQLRGCIGYIEGVGSLCDAVRDNAINAAARDPRFPRVQPSELDGIEIEISAMTPLEKVTDPGDIKVGRDGLVIEKGLAKGLLLPQVPVEWGWDRLEFLEHTCRKAGLPADAWKSGATLYRFEAEVFSEASMGIRNPAGL